MKNNVRKSLIYLVFVYNKHIHFEKASSEF
jgi:hypothetical protein